MKVMLGVPGRGIRNPYADKKKWRVFVQSSCTGNRHLDKDIMVLYEVTKILYGLVGHQYTLNDFQTVQVYLVLILL